MQISLINHRYNLALLLIVLILTAGYGCAGHAGSEEGGDLVATYGRHASLYRGEVDAFVPDSLQGSDSARIAGQYVAQWIRRQAVAEQAHLQIPDLEARLRYRKRAYEQSLIEQEYQQYLLSQDPSRFEVGPVEIKRYYEAHPDKFVAQTNFYQFFFLETPKTNQQYKVVNLIRSNEAEKIAELLLWCKENATAYKLDSSYLEAGALEPLSDGFYYGSLARASRTTPYPYTYTSGDTTYLRVFRMLATIEPGDRLPLGLCEDRIAAIIRNQRKRALVEAEEAKLVEQAKAGNKIRRY